MSAKELIFRKVRGLADGRVIDYTIDVLVRDTDTGEIVENPEYLVIAGIENLICEVLTDETPVK